MASHQTYSLTRSDLTASPTPTASSAAAEPGRRPRRDGLRIEEETELAAARSAKVSTRRRDAHGRRPSIRRRASTVGADGPWPDRHLRHFGIGRGRRQLHVAEVVDPDRPRPAETGARRPASVLGDDRRGARPNQRVRVDRGRPVPPSGTPRAQGGRGRGEEVAAVECAAAVGPPRAAMRAKARAIGAAADQFRRRDQQPVVRADEEGGRRARAASPRRRRPRRPEPTPGSTTASTTPGPRCGDGPHQVREPGPDVEGADLMGQIDDRRRPGTPRPEYGVDHTDELVLRPVVGEEEDGQPLSDAASATVPWPPPPPP